ncbi:MAG: Ig-like domain-containing protein [Armatimonadetes bacterium]|nr:Ig-like domain-containing protein [Armatimonadota bacterium]
MRYTRFFLVLAFGTAIVWGFTQLHQPAARANEEALSAAETQPTGLVFTVTEGSPEASREPAPRAARVSPLGPEQLQAVLKRLPAFKVKAEPTDFALREKSLPPPRTGNKLAQPFPPPEKPVPPEVKPGQLEVLRRAPEGPVPIAPQLSVTFNQPMVAVTSHEELAKQPPPVQLSPQPPGRWRWIGTKTVLFDPRGEVSPDSTQQARFPMATQYQVEVPAGTTASGGASLSSPVRWTFRTPTVTLVSSAPTAGPHDLTPLMWATFDQDIDAAAVFSTIKLTEGSNQQVALRRASDQELSAARLELTPKRFVAFKAADRLNPATTYTVRIGPGTPSAEGPLKTQTEQTYSFYTYNKFMVEEARCGWNGNCPPLTPFSIRFNNPIDVDKFDPRMIRVIPEIPRMKIDASGDSITIRGETQGRTSYAVQLAADLPDAFGQTLGKEEILHFQVGSAEPALMAVGGLLVTLDPAGPASFPVYCINQPELKVRVHAVEPKDWAEFVHRLARETHNDPLVPPGQQMVSTTLDTAAQADALREVRIDLKPALKDGKGMAIVVVEPTTTPGEPWNRQRVVSWVQVTEVGLDAAVDADEMLVLASRLETGNPLPGVELSLIDQAGKEVSRAASGQDGLANLKLGATAPVLVARLGGDVSILPQQAEYPSQGGWSASARADQLRWFVVDDRKMYRPDEKVSVKGWLRRWGAGPRGDISGLRGEVSRMSWTVTDSQGNEVLKGETPVTADGGFHLDFTLPKTVNLGYTHLGLTAGPSGDMGSSSYNHSFQVQEFRRPEFEVSARVSPEASIVGESAVATVEARYYAGGGLPAAPVSWVVTTSPGSYVPPGRDEYSFGTWTPWWDWHGWRSPEAHPKARSLQGRTDSSGLHHVKLDFRSVEPPRPTVVRAEASVTDVNRQAWSASTRVLVHPSDYYVGLKSPTTFVEKGDPIELQVLPCDRDGKIVPGVPVELVAWRQDYRVVRGQYKEVREDVQTVTETSSGQPVTVRFQTPAGGTYQLKARIRDAQGRPNESTLTVWVSGAEQPPAQNVEQQPATLVPDKKEYQAGDRAQILVQAPFYPAEGVLTLRRSGLLHHERFTMSGPTTVLTIPIEEGHVPNLYCQVDLVGAAEREEGGPKRPAYATGQLNLTVSPWKRSLEVSVQPVHASTDPGARTSLEVQVLGPDGTPVPNAEVALFAVDEAVLALTGYQFPNPLDVFYSSRGPEVSDYHSRQHVLLARLEQLTRQADDGIMQRANGHSAGMVPPPPPAPPPGALSEEEASGRLMAKGKSEADGAQPIKVRTDFNPTALFSPVVKTNASGKASVPFKLPDNLTRYRLVALATDGGRRFGKGESALVARLPLMVRPSPPRFLNFGDRCELPVVLQNQTDRELPVQVASRGVNLKWTGAAGYSLTIPANDRVEVRFPVTTDRAGTAAVQVGAVSGSYADAAELSLPVWTPATTEAFATYGEIDQGGVAQPVRAPADVFPQFGGLELTTSSTNLAALTDALLYLVSYPFDCAEQVSSRLLAVAALRDVLWAFKAEGMPDARTLQALVKKDVDRLAMLQSYDGGFGFWPTSPQTWPFISVHVAHSAVRAREKGYQVPDEMLQRSQSYMQNIEQHIPSWYGPDARRTIIAYSIYVRHRMKDTDIRKAHGLISEAGGIEKLPMEAVGWLYFVMCKDASSAAQVAAIRKLLDNRVTETAGAAHFATGYSEESGYVILASDRRVDGIVLEALIEDQPQSDLIPKLVRGLLAHRKRGRWENTQDNCFVLLALDRYFQVYEKATPDFVARVWLGDRFAGEQPFRGREVDSRNLSIPMSYLSGKGEQQLVLTRQGTGRLYYRIGMDYAPRSLKLEAADHGFAVERAYEAVDDPQEVIREADGTWSIRAGSRVRVRLTMVSPARRYHVALVDPLPAGLEPMNPTLAVSGTVPLDPAEQSSRGPWWYWLGTWYEHQNMRDERVEAFTSLLWGGVYNYTYVARATTPGQFVVPPCRAEEMYSPETFGRSATDRVKVVDR